MQRLFPWRDPLLHDRRGAVAVLFALSLLPITLAVALAVDYSFYIEAHAQLNLAADAAALHAVRVASTTYSAGNTTTAAADAAGQLSGQQWFAAQVGTIGSATISPSDVVVNVTYNQTPPGFTATVSYSGSVQTHFGKFIVPAWNIADSSSAVVENGYVEFVMLLDNSSSMLLAATQDDILKMETMTPCSTAGGYEGFTMGNYSWVYEAGYGYPGYDDPYSGKRGVDIGYITPPASPVNGQCYSTFTEQDKNTYPNICIYLPAYGSATGIDPKTGLCKVPPGGGANGSYVGSWKPELLYTPQAPCAFACHDRTDGKDYYTLAKNNNVTLRLTVVHDAASQIVQTLQSYSQIANQFSVGIYEFNSKLQTVYPPTGGGESGTDLDAASNAIKTAETPLTSDQGNTYFQTSATALASILTPAGNGNLAASPVKNLFIVTDGLSDMVVNGQQVLGTITSASNEQICQMFKDKGFNVFVLYTTYLPVPTQAYLDPNFPNLHAQQYAESNTGDPLIVQALKACASSPENYFLADDASKISTKMQQMLQAALNSAGRISK